MYGKIFRTMYGSTVADDWRGLVTFQQFIVLADIDGVVDMTAAAIARTTNIPLEIIQAGIAILEEPDHESRSPECEGRRLERLDADRSWGWRIVNYKNYRELTDLETVRAQNRVRQQRHRDKQAASRSVTHGHASSRQEEEEGDVEAVNNLGGGPIFAPRASGSNQIVVGNPPETITGPELILPTSATAQAAAESLLWFKQTWETYPKTDPIGRSNKQLTKRAWDARVREGAEPLALFASVEGYRAAIGRRGIKPEHVMGAQRFFGSAGEWKADWGTPAQEGPPPTYLHPDDTEPNPAFVRWFALQSVAS